MIPERRPFIHRGAGALDVLKFVLTLLVLGTLGVPWIAVASDHLVRWLDSYYAWVHSYGP